MSGSTGIHKGNNVKNAKLGQKGSGHVTYFLNFGTLHISRTREARNYKFGRHIAHEEP